MARRELLTNAGLDTGPLTNIDLIDAGLCALTAHRFTQGKVTVYDDPFEGYIVVPK